MPNAQRRHATAITAVARRRSTLPLPRSQEHARPSGAGDAAAGRIKRRRIVCRDVRM